MTHKIDDSASEHARAVLRDGLAARKRGDLDAARHAYERALALFADDSAGQVLTRVNLGALLHHLGELDAATEQFEAALVASEALGDRRRIAVCEGNLAALHLERGQHEDAERLLRAALDHYRELGDPAGIGNQLGNLGMLHQSRGEYPLAARCLAEAASAFEQAGHVAGAASTMRIAGDLHRRLGNTPLAREAFERALFLSRSTQDDQGEAYARRAIGQLHLASGEIDKSIGQFRAALSLHEQTRDARGISAAWLDLGQALVARGESAEGLDALERAVTIARERKLSAESLGSSLLAWGTQLAHAGQPQKGLDALMESLGIYTDLGDPHGSCAAYLNRASVLLLLGRWSEVDGTLDEAARLATERGLAPILPSVAALRGQLASLVGELPAALVYLDAAVDGFEGVHRGKLAASARISRSLLRVELGMRDPSIEQELREIATDAAERSDFSARADALQALARLARAERRFDDAVTHLDEALELVAPYHNPSAEGGLLVQRAAARLRREHWAADRFEQLDAVERDLDRAEALIAPLGFAPRHALIKVWRAELLRRQHELDAAGALLDEVRADAEALGFRLCLGYVWLVGAYLARDLRDARGLSDAVAAAADLFEDCGALAALEELGEDFGAE